jgi:DNA-binding transcriptional ArsR family regulator
MAMSTALESTAGIARVFAHPMRLRLALLLETGEACTCDLLEVLSISRTTLMDHLRELRRHGIVEAHKHGRWTYFEVSRSDHARAWIDVVVGSVGHDPAIAEDVRRLAVLRRIRSGNGCR